MRIIGKRDLDGTEYNYALEITKDASYNRIDLTKSGTLLLHAQVKSARDFIQISGISYQSVRIKIQPERADVNSLVLQINEQEAGNIYSIIGILILPNDDDFWSQYSGAMISDDGRIAVIPA